MAALLSLIRTLHFLHELNAHTQQTLLLQCDRRLLSDISVLQLLLRILEELEGLTRRTVNSIVHTWSYTLCIYCRIQCSLFQLTKFFNFKVAVFCYTTVIVVTGASVNLYGWDRKTTLTTTTTTFYGRNRKTTITTTTTMYVWDRKTTMTITTTPYGWNKKTTITTTTATLYGWDRNTTTTTVTTTTTFMDGIGRQQ